jgi:hypothetical protein
VRGAVQEIGAEFVPADGDVIDEVACQGMEIAGEAPLEGGQQQRQMVAGHPVELHVDADVARAGRGGAGDEGAGGQRNSKGMASGGS